MSWYRGDRKLMIEMPAVMLRKKMNHMIAEWPASR